MKKKELIQVRDQTYAHRKPFNRCGTCKRYQTGGGLVSVCNIPGAEKSVSRDGVCDIWEWRKQ